MNVAVSSPLPLKTSKKEIRKSLQEKLTTLLGDYRTMMGDKKFDRSIKRTARVFGSDILRSLPKKKKGNKKNVEKAPE